MSEQLNIPDGFIEWHEKYLNEHMGIVNQIDMAQEAWEMGMNTRTANWVSVEEELFDKCFEKWVPQSTELVLDIIERDDIYAWCKNILNMYLVNKVKTPANNAAFTIMERGDK